jgi:integrase
VVLRTSMPFLKGKTLRQIKPADLERFKAVRTITPTRHGRPRKPATIHREFKVLSAAFSMAVDNDLCESNPCRKVKLPKFDNVQDKVLDVENIERFLFAFRNSLQRDIAQTVIYTGLRQNDVLGLRKEHIRDGEIRLTQGKTKRRVGIPIDEAIRPMLEARMEKYDDLLFPSYRTGKRLVSIKNGIRFACLRAGIPVLTIRDLRRTYGTLLHDNGTDDKTVADLLGHSDTRCVHRYKRGSKSKKQAIQELGKSVKRASISASTDSQPRDEKILVLAQLMQELGIDEVEMRRIELLASALRRQEAPDVNTLTYSQID